MSIARALVVCAVGWASATAAVPARAEPVVPDETGAARDEERNLDDAAITVEVERQLATAAPSARHVEISTRNGIVTVAGRVESREMRQRVVSLAIATDGVIGVNDQLVIVPKPSPAPGR